MLTFVATHRMAILDTESKRSSALLLLLRYSLTLLFWQVADLAIALVRSLRPD